jgi:hypothetical protein
VTIACAWCWRPSGTGRPPRTSKLLLDVTHLTTVTSGGTTTTSGGVGERLWGFGAGSKDFSVSAGMGLVYDSLHC